VNRALPAAAVLALTLLTAGAAAGLNTALGSWIAPEEGALQKTAMGATPAQAKAPTASPPARAPRVQSESEYIHQILVRNIFDAAFIDTYSPKKPGEEDDGVEELTDLRVTLLGTVVAIPEQFSSALIATEGSERPYGYGIGDRIEDAEIVRIEQKLVHLRRGNGQIELLKLSAEPEEPSTRRTTAATTEAPKGEGGIEQVSETSFVVDRSLLEKHLQDLEGLSRLGRALLHRGPDGEFDGYRLSAIRRGTVVDQLGIKNGDIIHSVNGQPLNSVQGAMNAYQNLMNESSFTFEVTRRGQRMTMEYQVR